MSPIEIAAAALTLISVLLTSHLKRSLYPVGIAATVLYAVVFWRAQLYASVALQVWFTVIQLYGWWYWTRGNRGAEPPIGTWSWKTVALLAVPAVVMSIAVSVALAILTDAASPALDTAILSLSVLAQFLLDRKQIKHWPVWAAADMIAIVVYGGQGLWLTAGLYVLLLLNVAYGWVRWARALEIQTAEQAG